MVFPNGRSGCGNGGSSGGNASTVVLSSRKVWYTIAMCALFVVFFDFVGLQTMRQTAVRLSRSKYAQILRDRALSVAGGMRGGVHESGVVEGYTYGRDFVSGERNGGGEARHESDVAETHSTAAQRQQSRRASTSSRRRVRPVLAFRLDNTADTGDGLVIEHAGTISKGPGGKIIVQGRDSGTAGTAGTANVEANSKSNATPNESSAQHGHSNYERVDSVRGESGALSGFSGFPMQLTASEFYGLLDPSRQLDKFFKRKLPDEKHFNHMGCFLDKGGDRALRLMLSGDIDSVLACYKLAEKSGMYIFGLQRGIDNTIECWASEKVNLDLSRYTKSKKSSYAYSRHGSASTCFNYMGNILALDVYKVSATVYEHIDCKRNSADQTGHIMDLPHRLSAGVRTVRDCAMLSKRRGFVLFGVMYVHSTKLSECWAGWPASSFRANEGPFEARTPALSHLPSWPHQKQRAPNLSVCMLFADSNGPPIIDMYQWNWPVQAPVGSREHLGCYKDDADKRVLPFRLGQVYTVLDCAWLAKANGHYLFGLSLVPTEGQQGESWEDNNNNNNNAAPRECWGEDVSTRRRLGRWPFVFLNPTKIAVNIHGQANSCSDYMGGSMVLDVYRFPIALPSRAHVYRRDNCYIDLPDDRAFAWNLTTLLPPRVALRTVDECAYLARSVGSYNFALSQRLLPKSGSKNKKTYALDCWGDAPVGGEPAPLRRFARHTRHGKSNSCFNYRGGVNSLDAFTWIDDFRASEDSNSNVCVKRRQVDPKLREMLQCFHSIVGHLRIQHRYFITGGTLLGRAQTRKFVPWDSRVEIAIFQTDTDKIAALADDSFYDVRPKLHDACMDFHLINVYNPWRGFRLFPTNRDIPYDGIEPCRDVWTDVIPNASEADMPVSECELDAVQTRCPDNPGRILRLQYGPDFLTPYYQLFDDHHNEWVRGSV